MESRRLSRGKITVKVLFLATVVLAALMPGVPEPADPRALAFAIAAGLLLLRWLGHRLITGTWPASSTAVWLMGFLAVVLASALTASLFETPFDFWLRGAIPFLFLALFFPALDLARRDPQWVLDALCASAIAWLVNTTIVAATAVPLVLRGDVARITHAIEAWDLFQLPYAMVGLALVLFHPPSWIRGLRWILAAAFSLAPILAVSRGQIVVVVALCTAYFIQLPGRVRRRAVLPLCLLAGGVAFVIFRSELATAIIARFSAADIESESSRLAELQYAFQQFLTSPLLGKGLGHQVPADVTFAGDIVAIMEAGGESVGYIHNVVGYLLMDLGLWGLMAYGGFIIAGLRNSRGAGSLTHGAVRRASIAILLALLMWFVIQAAFRQIQSNLLLGTVIAVLSATRPRATPATHAQTV